MWTWAKLDIAQWVQHARSIRHKNMRIWKQVASVILALASVRAFGTESLRTRDVAEEEVDDHQKLQPEMMRLDSLAGLEFHTLRMKETSAQADITTYRERPALRIITKDGLPGADRPLDGQAIAIVQSPDFRDGTIEIELAGLPREGSPSFGRGFIGIAFRVQNHGLRFEAIFLRMTNGRSDDELRRNHSTQYISEPDFPWYRSREENPGIYESYVDLDPGAWTKVRVIVSGIKAALYVNGAEQPCLIVNDLKLGNTRGQVALWVGGNTEAYFSNLRLHFGVNKQ
jgi:hypothetical protein